MNSLAQHVPFQHFGIGEGLMDEKCYDIAQDKNGFIWLGTNSGLVRFDGDAFKTFEINGRTDIDVYDVLIQKDRLVLITEDNGIYVLEEDSIIQLPSAHELLNKDEIFNKIAIDNENIIWFGITVDSSKSFKFKKLYRDNRVETLEIPFDQEAGYYTILLPNKESVTSRRLIYNTNRSFSVAVEYNNSIREIELPFGNNAQNMVSDIRSFRNDLIALSYGKQLFIVGEKKRWIIPLNDFAQPRGIYVQNDSIIWCATRFNALNKIVISHSNDSNLNWRIEEYPEIIDASNYYQPNSNQLWITSGKTGLYYCPSTETVQYNQLENINDFTFFRGELLLATRNNDLILLNNEKKDTLNHFERRVERIFSTKRQIVVLNYNSDDQVLKNGMIQSTKYNGVKTIVEKDSSFFLARKNFSREYNFSGKIEEFSFTEPNDEMIQVSSSVIYERVDSLIYKTNIAKEPYLRRQLQSVENVFDLESTQSGRVFYTDLDGAFFEIHEDGSIQKLLNRHPIFKEPIHQIVEDSDHLCIVFNNCILRFNSKTLDDRFEYLFRTPGIYEGQFTKLEIQDGVYYWTSAGKLYSSRNPFQSKEFTPISIQFELKDRNLKGKSEIKKSYSENSVVVQVRGFNYEGNPYFKQIVEINSMSGNSSYELKGPDIFLADLSTGEHVINSYNLNLLTKQRSGISTLNVIIQKPIWMTNWFRITLIVLIVLLIFLFIYRKNRNELEWEKVVNQLNKVRTQAVASQLNPHFIFNALGSIQYLVNDGKADEANAYLSKFAKLLRIVLEHTELDWYAFSLEKEILELYLSLENLRFKKAIEIKFLNNTNFRENEICVPPMFLQILVENSIIHGLRNVEFNGKIQIELSDKAGRWLQIKVKDNGVGFGNTKTKRDDKKSSLGLSLIQDRLKVISRVEGIPCKLDWGNCIDEESFVTEVKITVPIKKCHEED